MNLGWKTITGAICLGVAQLLSASISDCPVPAWVPWLKWFSSLFNAGGMVLAGVGISSKVASATNSVVESLNKNNINTIRAMSDQKFVEKVIERRVPYVVKRLGPDDEIIVRRPKENEPEAVKKPPA